MPLDIIPLPFGLRQVALTPYTDAAATTLGTSVYLPNPRTLSFAEVEEFEDLRGGDRLVTSHGNGGEVEWELEGGGTSFEAVAVMYGGIVNTTGVTPNQVKTLTKYVGTTFAQSQRPSFRITGRSISDSGGDFWCIIYRAKATDNLEGEMSDGSFFLTGASGKGYASNEASTLNRIWQWVQNETETAI